MGQVSTDQHQTPPDRKILDPSTFNVSNYTLEQTLTVTSETNNKLTCLI